MKNEPGWFERRLPLGAWTKQLLTEDVPGGASYWYVFGSVTLLTFATLVLTGIWQLLYYVPTTDRAYDSVNYLRFQVPWGWLIHGLHYWAATFMVILVLVHLTQVFVWGAFKKPREFTWILGGLLLIFTLLAVFTGSPLPWDKRGYLAAQVGNGIAGSIPLAGGLAQQALWGGSTVGQLSLSRLFGIHVAIVPIILALIIGLHVAAFREPGAAASFSEKRNKARLGMFWPDQVLKDVVAFTAVFVVLVGLASFLQTPVGGAADPLDSTFIGKPEWPFLFFYQALKYLPGRLEIVGVVVLPLVLFGLLFALPWLDRRPERSPARRPIAIAIFIVIVGAIVALGVQGAGGPSELVSKSAPGVATAETTAVAQALAKPPADTAQYTIGNAEHGATIFANYCEGCHGPAGNGKSTSPLQPPALAPIDPAFVATDTQTFVDNIDPEIQTGSVKDGTVNMPPFGATGALTQPQIADVEAYVLKLNGVNRAAIENPGVDPKTFFVATAVVFLVLDVVAVVALVSRKERA
jgi:ubiquinol-cytochrome c reductase cytochrome b subunit